LSAAAIDRSAVRTALDRLGGSSLVMAGTREKLRVHMHLDDPARLFDCLTTFGDVRARKADDMQAQQRATHAVGQVAIVVDSAADIPPDVLERLPLQVVPVRVTVGAEDFLDKVSLSADAFYALLRTSTHTVRTSQPPASDFRRLFEFLLSHHAEVLYVGVSRAISGTLQAGESAAAAFGSRVHVFDTANVSGGQGLLARRAGELAQSGLDADAIVRDLTRLRERTRTFAYVRDLTSAVRGGRVPSWSLPITRWLGLVPMMRMGGGDGRLHVFGVGLDRTQLVDRFVAKVLRSCPPGPGCRAQVMHCDNPDEAVRVRDALLRQRPDIECAQPIEAGSAIGAHAGAGAIVLALMPMPISGKAS
jgi:DegV family protein with EDD domain